MTQVYKVTVFINTPRAGVIENVMHYDAPDPSSPDNPWEVAHDIATAWATTNDSNMAGCIGNDCTIAAVSAERIYPTGGPTAVNILDIGGAADGPIADGAICANCQLITDVAPYHEGHQFLGALPATAVSGNVFSSGILSSIAAYLAGLILPLVGSLPGVPTYHIGVWNRKTHVLEKIVHTQIAPKPTSLNKRLGPYLN